MPTPKTPKPLTARGATENVTGVYRLPGTVKSAIEAEALSDAARGLSTDTPAAIVRVALARELARRGYKLTDATRRACHVE